jgi:hypothetical protein
MRSLGHFLVLTNYEHMLIIHFDGSIIYGKTQTLQKSWIST